MVDAENVAAEDVVIPALLRAARGAYGHAIRARLADGGFDDMPANGPYVLGGIVNHNSTAGELIRQLGISRQAASQLIDVLVLRGYLERAPNTDDRRRMTITVTARGRDAAAAVRTGVISVDEQLADACTPEEIAGLRSGLIALCDIRERFEDQMKAHALS